MKNQQLTAITRGLQHAAAETNAIVAEQYLSVLAQYFDKDEDGTLRARTVKVQLSEEHYSMVPLVALATPTGLALERMRVELSLRVEDATRNPEGVVDRLKSILGRKNSTSEEDDSTPPASQHESPRTDFQVSLSPRTGKSGERPSDHIHIDLEFRAIETPEAVMRVIETYTSMIQPLRISDGLPIKSTK